MQRLFVISNRVAVPDGGQTAGGLAVALHAALENRGGVWFGWSGKISGGDDPPRAVHQGKASFVTIDLAAGEHENYYQGYSNRGLWPLCHYRTDLAVFEDRYRAAYYQVNARFAKTLVSFLEPDDLVWVHDYHLIPCGAELRGLGVKQRLGFFLHIPFPSPAVLTTLPDHQRLLRSLFAYDLVGFQTRADVQALQDYVTQVAGGRVEADGRLTAFGRSLRAEAFPIGMEARRFVSLAEGAVAARAVRQAREALPGQQLLIGVDRLDYSKGIPQRLVGLGRLLDEYPDWRGKLSLLLLAAASRSEVPEYVRIREQVEGLVGHINGRHGTVDWVPVRYQNQTLDRAAMAGLLRAARIGLVTPLRDGMNLVAKEYVAAQDPADPGVLVLSRFAGAADQFRDGALLVNPHDTRELAEAIRQALDMPLEERKRRWRGLMDSVLEEDVHWWRESFVRRLAE